MDDSQQQQGSQLFLVRLWLEQEDGRAGDDLWRGKVQHLLSGKVGAFDSHASLLQVLIALMSAAETQRGGDEEHPG